MFSAVGRLGSILLVVAFSFLRIAPAKGQSTLAECVAQYTWMSNSKAQNPCLVAAYLLVPCDGPVDAVVEKLESPNQIYLGPFVQDSCMCNTVAYSMIEACQRCQFDSPDPPLPWGAYSQNCTDVSTTYPPPISPGTAIPAWASLDVIAHDTFNVTLAKIVADEGLPDMTASPTPTSLSTSTSTSTSTPTPTPTSTTVTFSASSTSTSSTSSAASTSSPSSTGVSGVGGSSTEHKTDNIAAIVGGAVGGVVGLCLLGTLIYSVLLCQRRMDRAAAPAAEPSVAGKTAGTPDGTGPYGRKEGERASGSLAKSPAMTASSPSLLYVSVRCDLFPPPRADVGFGFVGMDDPDDPLTYPTAASPPPSAGRAASPTPSVFDAGHVRMQSFGGREYPRMSSVVYRGQEGGFAGSVYRGIPEV